jgi:ABC-type dipeptide/oligopeptide/nickel transport system permease subunit
VSTGAAELLQDTGGTVTDAAVTTPAEIAARSPLQLFWRRLKQDKVAMVALGFIVLLVLVALLAPQIVKLFGAHPPNEQNSDALDDFGSAAAPGNGYLMGTDGLGRDVFSRVLYGARVSLEVALISTTLIVVIGVTMGMIAGYYRGWVDTGLARIMDVVLAFPVLLLALGLGAACSFGNGCLQMNFGTVGLVLVVASVVGAAITVACKGVRPPPPGGQRPRATDLALAATPWLIPFALGLFFVIKGGRSGLIQPGLPVVIFIIALAGVPYMARIIRGQVLSIREKEYIEAALSLGASDSRIIFRHVLPNLVAPIIVYTTLIIPVNILFEASLSFLGVGVQPPTASWGAMIADAIEIFDTAWWYMTFPGLALLLTVLAFNLVGDGLQDALNPRTGR